MGLHDVFANQKLAKIRKAQEEAFKVSRDISLGDSAETESMRNHFPKEVAILQNYAKLAQDLFLYIKKNPDVSYILKDMDILPPFVVFPWLSPESVDWKEGICESYADMFKRMMNQKSPAEQDEYCKKYPYPDWWIQDPPCHNTLYQEYWESDSVETGYDDRWRMCLCVKYREKHC